MDYTQDQETVYPVSFWGNAKEFFNIWVVNTFLTVVTLGIYSAWAKVRTNRYIYGNTTLHGSSFDYTANPVAILKGRLIAFVLLVIYMLVDRFAPVFSPVMLLVLLLVFPLLLVRSLQFRLQNMVYRNVRFNFIGAFKQTWWFYIKQFFLIGITFGLYYPYFIHKQNDHIVNRSLFGDKMFAYDGQGGTYYKIYFIAGLLAILGYFLALILVLPIIQHLIAAQADAQPRQLGLGMLFFMAAVMGIIYFLVNSYLSAKVTNYRWSVTTLDENRFSCTLSPWKLMWIQLTNLIAIVVSFGLMTPWAKIRMVRYRLGQLKMMSKDDLNGFINTVNPTAGSIGDETGEMFDMDISL